MKIGFIGQGWIGKHYADEFELRKHDVVRYALEAPYISNKDLIASCHIVFIAVPTPTTLAGFDYNIVVESLTLVGSGNTAVIKSTLLPGTTEKLQEQFPEIFVVHSPEFLVEKTAAFDAAHPKRNLIGIPKDTPEYREKATAVLAILPYAPYTKIMQARDAELVKYAGNCFLYTKVIFMNMLYDLASAQGVDWETLREALVHDPRIGDSHTNPIHSSGRGAGGHCFIKDFEAFRLQYAEAVGDQAGNATLQALVDKNAALLITSNKDLDLLMGVYGNTYQTKEAYIK